MKQLFFFLFAIVLLTSCGHYADGTSVWAGGLFLIPSITLAGALIFGYQAYVASRSNSTTQDKDRGIIDNTGDVPIYKLGKFYFAVALFVATIVIIIMVNADK